MSFDSLKAQSYYQLPPDGAGKRIFANEYWQVSYTPDLSGSVARGDYVSNQLGVQAEVMNVDYYDSTYYVSFMPEDEGGAGEFAIGDVLSVGGTPFGTVTSFAKRYAQANINIGKNNPRWGQYVDKDGAAYVRFSEGPQQLDSYGLTRIVEPQLIASYNFLHDIENEDFYTELSGAGATASYGSGTHCVILDVGSAPNERAMFASKMHYPAWPGSSQLINLVVNSGDAGKDGVIRRWGYYDDWDGIFYEQSGSSVSVVKRSSTSGTPVDTKISQSAWNVDNISANESNDGMILDVSKLNNYYMNLAAGGGKIVFGVFNEVAERVRVHVLSGLNRTTAPTMTRPSLPVRFEILNGPAGSASPSRISLYGISVKAEGPEDGDEQVMSRFSSFMLPMQIPLSGTSMVPVASFRSAMTFKGSRNTLITVPHAYNIYVSGSPVTMCIHKNATLTSASFGPAGTNTGVEGDFSATAMSGGREVSRFFFGEGTYNEHFPEHIWGVKGECMTLLSNDEYGDVYTVAFSCIDAAGTASIAFGATWSDVG